MSQCDACGRELNADGRCPGCDDPGVGESTDVTVSSEREDDPLGITKGPVVTPAAEPEEDSGPSDEEGDESGSTLAEEPLDGEHAVEEELPAPDLTDSQSPTARDTGPGPDFNSLTPLTLGEAVSKRGPRAPTLILLAGISEAGKSSFAQAAMERRYKGRPTRIRHPDRTPPGEWREFTFEQPASPWRRALGRSKRASFIDISGEDYQSLYFLDLAHRQEGVPSAEGGTDHLFPQKPVDVEVARRLRKIVDRLGGVVLTIDMTRLWFPLDGQGRPMQIVGLYESMGPDDWDRTWPVWAHQAQLATWFVRLLRWLRFSAPGEGAEASISLERVEQELEKAPRLDIPIQILFTKADRLGDVHVPEKFGRSERAIREVAVNPMVFANQVFPSLFDVLRQQVEYYRFDFSYVVKGIQETAAPEWKTRGVSGTMRWLLKTCPGWGTLSTRFWLQRWMRQERARYGADNRWRRP